MAYVLATVAAFAVLSLGIAIIVLALVIRRLRALEKIEIWTRSFVDDLGRLLTDLRLARDFQSMNTKTVHDLEPPGSTSSPSGA